METLITFNFVVFLLISGIPFFRGLDIKKWLSWLYGLYGFVTGFLAGLMWADVLGGVQLGIVFAFIVMYGGATTYWHKQRFK